VFILQERKPVAKLTQKQEQFCLEYIIDLNGTQAAIRAGYPESSAGSIGAENLTKHAIQQRLTELKKERGFATKTDAEYVLRRLREIDDLDIIDILNDDLTAFKPLSEWPQTWRKSISGFDLQAIISDDELPAIVRKVKWPDKVKNLEMIGRHVEVKAWDKEETIVKSVTNIMPVPNASSVDDWESSSKSVHDELLNKDD